MYFLFTSTINLPNRVIGVGTLGCIRLSIEPVVNPELTVISL